MVADASTPSAWAAIDVVLQAEHGPDGLAWLITWDEAVADAVTEAVAEIVPRSPRREHLEATLAEGGYAVLCDGPEHAIEIANAIAPEHLELLVADPDALLPLVRHAGAVFCGPYAPASVGDYLAGPNHVLPTYGSARFSGALRVDDFLKHVHVVSVDQAALRRGGGARDRARHLRGPRRPRRIDPPAAGRPGMTISPRDDLALMEGYHSPQVEVAVRLNTNEAPEPPPAGLRGRARHGDGHARVAPLPRPLLHARCATAIAAHHGVDPAQVFAANGSNEVLQTLCLAYGGPGRTAAVFEPTYALHSHIARVTGTGVATGERTDDLALDLDEVRRVLAAASPAITFVCSPNNPTGMLEDEATVRTVLDLAPGSWSWTRPTASSRRGRRSSWSPTTARSSSPAPTPRRGRWRRPASATSSARVRWWPSSTRWCSRTTSMP